MNFDEALRQIYSQDVNTKVEAARVLGTFYDTEGVTALLAVFDTTDNERVKIAIIQSLGRVYAMEAVSRLDSMMWVDGISSNLQYEAKAALSKIESYRAQMPEDARSIRDNTNALPRDSMGEVPDADMLVMEGIEATYHLEHEQAQNLLHSAVQIDPYNATGWLWLSLFAESRDEHRLCIDNVLFIDPENDHALRIRAMIERHQDVDIATMKQADDNLYTVGGNVAQEGKIYVKRPADDELFQNCMEGVLSYVLTSRQRGKSSIVVQTAARLEARGIATVIVDLSGMGATAQTIDEFYFGILYNIAKRFGVSMRKLSKWWQEMSQISAVQRFDVYLREELLPTVETKLVVFIDEVDTVRALSKSFPVDDFFAVIRAMHNARSIDPICRKLTFALLGVAQPTDLINDDKRTPFNIGARIDLTDFNLLEALELADGLGLPLDKTRSVMGWVLHWTNGHPNLSQKLCRALARQPQSTRNRQSVDALVQKLFISPDSPDDNIQFVESMFTSHPDTVQLVILYYRIIKGLPVNDGDDMELVEHLKLAGIIRSKDGRLVVRNRIYAAYFDDSWIDDRLSPALTLEELDERFADTLKQETTPPTPRWTRIKPIARDMIALSNLQIVAPPDEKLPVQKRMSTGLTDLLRDLDSETELAPATDTDDHADDIDTDDLDDSPFYDDYDAIFTSDDTDDTDDDDDDDGLGWLRGMSGDYLREDGGLAKNPFTADTTPSFQTQDEQQLPKTSRFGSPTREISVTGNVDDDYDWIERIHSDTADPVNRTSEIDTAPMPSDDGGLDTDALTDTADADSNDKADEPAQSPATESNADGVDSVQHLSPESADNEVNSVEALDQLWLSTIENAVQNVNLLPDARAFFDDQPDVVNIEDEGEWLDFYDDVNDDLIIRSQRPYDLKRGEVVYVPDADLEFTYTGKTFILKPDDDDIPEPEPDFQPLYLQLAENPSTYTPENMPALPASPSRLEHLAAQTRSFMEKWRGALLIGAGVLCVLIGVGTMLTTRSIGDIPAWSIIFAVAGIAIITPGWWLLRRDSLEQTIIEERLGTIGVQPDVVAPNLDSIDMLSVLETAEKPRFALEDLRIFQNVTRHWKYQLRKAGFEMTLNRYAFLHVLGGVVMYVLGLLLFTGDQVTALILGLAGVYLPEMVTAFVISHRVSQIKFQLPDTLSLWVNALRSGYSVLQALEAISRDAAQPTASEFSRLVQELRVGIDMQTAFDHMLERVDDEDLDFVFTAVNIQREVGGNLAEILEVISDTIRERIKLAGETATQVKARYRTFFLIALCLPLIQTVVAAPYFNQALTSTTGQLALFIGYNLIGITLMFSANINRLLRRDASSTDNYWMLRRERLFDMGVGLLLLGLVYASNTAPLLVFWLGLMLFIIVTDHPLIGYVLSLPIIATAIFTDGDLSRLGERLNDVVNVSITTQTVQNGALLIGGLLVVVGMGWGLRRIIRTGLRRQASAQQGELSLSFSDRFSLIDRLSSFFQSTITPLLPFSRVAPAKPLLQMLTHYPTPNPDKQTIDMVKTIQKFYLLSMAFAVVGAGIGAFISLQWITTNPASVLAYMLVGAGVGYMIPAVNRYYVLRRRREKVRNALPDALDLLVICMEAGLGFDSAMGKIYEKWDNELALSFGRVLREIQLGKLRRQALSDMAGRISIPDVDAFVAAVVQSDMLGVSLARTMRIQSSRVRHEWRTRLDNRLNGSNQVMDQLSLFLFVPGINLWLIAPIIAGIFAG